MALTNAILATPSTLVVPLSAIIDRLQGKLSAADLNNLLLSVTGTVKSQVQPGDPITADLMNEVLAAVGDLQIRVATLEGAGPFSSAVRIDGLRAIQPLRVNDPAEIYGAGFLVPALLNTVTMGGLPVANLRGSATQLFFQVPRLAVSSAGTTTTVTVVNANGTASSAPIMVLPEPIVPSGQTQLTYTTPPVMPAGQLVDPAPVDIDPDHPELLRQRNRQRQPDIAEPDHRNLVVLVDGHRHSDRVRRRGRSRDSEARREPRRRRRRYSSSRSAHRHACAWQGRRR